MPASPAEAAALCRVVLDCVSREWPYRPELWLESAADLELPRQQHPLFHTSYDWHSCVHMHWSVLRLLRLHGDGLDQNLVQSILAHFDRRFTVSAVAAECALFDRPGHHAFERPYGWGWLLALQAELVRVGGAPRAGQEAPQPIAFGDRGQDLPARWAATLAPLASRLALSMLDYLPRLDHPVRSGTHANTAFASVLALDHARHCSHPALARCIERQAHRWFGHDRRYPAAYEPGGEDFLSPGLVEAVLMYRVLDSCDFADWWAAFSPASQDLVHWLEPVRPSDETDARLVHLHGLNLSRAWCWRALLPGLPPALKPAVGHAIDAHRLASAAAATRGDYVATHWLASFLLLSCDADRP